MNLSKEQENGEESASDILGSNSSKGMPFCLIKSFTIYYGLEVLAGL